MVYIITGLHCFWSRLSCITVFDFVHFLATCAIGVVWVLEAGRVWFCSPNLVPIVLASPLTFENV